MFSSIIEFIENWLPSAICDSEWYIGLPQIDGDETWLTAACARHYYKFSFNLDVMSESHLIMLENAGLPRASHDRGIAEQMEGSHA